MYRLLLAVKYAWMQFVGWSQCLVVAAWLLGSWYVVRAGMGVLWKLVPAALPDLWRFRDACVTRGESLYVWVECSPSLLMINMGGE